MGCRALVVAVCLIAFAWPATAAAAGPPPGIHDALRLEMLSGPAPLRERRRRGVRASCRRR